MQFLDDTFVFFSFFLLSSDIYNFHLTQHWEKLGKTATKTQKISQKYTFETSQQIEKFGLA